MKFEPLAELVHPLGDLLTFSLLVTAALVWRRRSDVHKRLMLLAAVGSMMAAPLIHLLSYFPPLRAVPPLILLPLAALYFSSAIHDRLTLGRMHPVSKWVGPVTLGLCDVPGSRDWPKCCVAPVRGLAHKLRSPGQKRAKRAAPVHAALREKYGRTGKKLRTPDQFWPGAPSHTLLQTRQIPSSRIGSPEVPDMYKKHRIVGGGGVRLHAVETGNPRGWPIVFIHGFSQCSLAWSRQMHSELADTFRLVALDLRGHGLSEKPLEGYADSKLWAADIDAVIRALHLDHPVLCGWSYGPLVILDYIRHYGEDDIRGVNFVGGVTKLGSDEAASVLAPDLLSLIPGFFSTDPGERSRCDSLARMCFARPLSDEEFYLTLGYNVRASLCPPGAVHPRVRQ